MQRAVWQKESSGKGLVEVGDVIAAMLRFGSREIPRTLFLQLVSRGLESDALRGEWTFETPARVVGRGAAG